VQLRELVRAQHSQPDTTPLRAHQPVALKTMQGSPHGRATHAQLPGQLRFGHPLTFATPACHHHRSQRLVNRHIPVIAGDATARLITSQIIGAITSARPAGTELLLSRMTFT
jgi:hypothetical protein